MAPGKTGSVEFPLVVISYTGTVVDAIVADCVEAIFSTDREKETAVKEIKRENPHSIYHRAKVPDHIAL